VLEDLGFGLDLTACAATGARSDLIYVSPEIRPRGFGDGRCALGGADAGLAGVS
jgi:recombinational DNA repair protein (RecF pathway)